MELMDTSLDKFYKKVIEKGRTIPEDILGKITVAVSHVLDILKPVSLRLGGCTCACKYSKGVAHFPFL